LGQPAGIIAFDPSSFPKPLSSRNGEIFSAKG
jgi:hypothetical protein